MAEDTFDRTTKRKIIDRKSYNSYIEHNSVFDNIVLLQQKNERSK